MKLRITLLILTCTCLAGSSMLASKEIKPLKDNDKGLEGKKEPPAKKTRVKTTRDKKPRFLTGKKGQEIPVRLWENPKQKIKWRVAELPKGLELVKEKHVKSKVQFKGYTGKRHFAFMAAKPGKYSVMLKKHDPKKGESTKTYEIDVTE